MAIMTEAPDVEGGVSRLAAIERRHDLFAYRYDGWSAWRVMRNAAYQAAGGLPLVKPNRRDWSRSLAALVGTTRLLWILLLGRRKDLLVKTCRSALRLEVDGTFLDVHFDGLLTSGYTALKLEEVNTPNFEMQAAAALRPADLDPVVFTFWGRILGTLLPADVKQFCDDTSRLLRDEAGIDMKPGWLRMRVSTAFWQSRMFAAVLRRVRPRAVMVADTGEYALNIACHGVGVRFVELQHGIFDASHPDAVPDWVEGSTAELLLPDVLACFGTFWIERLRGTRQGLTAVAVGNQIIERARSKRSQRILDSCKRMVLTSQGLDSERLADWTEEMLSSAPEGLAWRLTIKLHPYYDAQTAAFDRFAEVGNVEVVRGEALPNVYDLLAQADLHLSVASACHFDAAALGIPSVIVPLAGHESMLPVADQKSLFVISSPSDVWSVLAGPATSAQRASSYVAPGFAENLRQLVPAAA